MDFHELRDIAVRTLRPRRLSKNASAGEVAAVIETDKGNVFSGVCIDTCCSMGFCAEHAAVAAMVTAGESKIVKLVAVAEDGSAIPPCGWCREFICQIDDENIDCQVMLTGGKITTMAELLPHRWK